MKTASRVAWLAFFLFSALPLLSAPAAPAVKLTGIVRLEKEKRAFLEIVDVLPGRPSSTRAPILREGERDGDCEVTAIDETNAVVKVRHASQVIDLKLEQAPAEQLANRTLNLQAAKFEQALEVYQELIGRTVIRSTALPTIRLDLRSGAGLSDREAAAMIAQALADNDLFLKPSGDKFVFLIPAGKEGEFAAIPAPPVPQAIPDPPIPQTNPAEAVFEPGLIKLVNASYFQVLDIYAELTERTVLQSASLPWTMITVRSQTPLSKTEAVWLLDAVFRVNGIVMVPESEKFVSAVPVSRTRNLPKFDPQSTAAKAVKGAPAGMLRFNDATLDQVLVVYAALLGREPLPVSKQVPAARFSLRNQQALSPAEAVFALDAIASLNNFRFELVGDSQVQIVHAAAPRTPSR